ncbi:MAG: large conductance mechanosensitive channel protein MscL [Clostridia bacterium]|nr:large conductance mechanosensitive channel protein MscL [Clostridia bacterium]
MKKFFGEFKKFITRGNVIDMAVGVIVGSSFTAVVTGLCNYVLKPITNWLLAMVLSKDTLAELYTILQPAYMTDEAGLQVLDLANSIYIDWGAFINAIINFLLIAITLFTIVKVINKVRESQEALAHSIADGKPTKEERREMKKLGIKFSDKAAVSAYYAEKAKKAEEEKAAAEEKAKADRLANPTTEDLLKEIRDLLKKA